MSYFNTIVVLLDMVIQVSVSCVIGSILSSAMFKRYLNKTCPLEEAKRYINAGSDRNGFEKRLVSEAIGECLRFLISYYILELTLVELTLS